MNKILLYCIITVLMSSYYTCLAQNNNAEIPHDSLKVKTYQELKDKFQENENNPNLANIYAIAFLHQAKQKTDTIKMAEGYYLLASNQSEKYAMSYIDSIVTLTKNLGDKEYPGSAYILKGNIFFLQSNYKQAFEQYLIATGYAKKSGNELQYLTLKFNIGLLKNQLGEREEALEVFRDYVKYISEKKLKYDHIRYNKGLYALSEAYTYNGKLDSAEIYINEGIKETLKTNDLNMYYLFVFQSGVNFYFQKKYRSAIDSLSKAEKQFTASKEQDKKGIAICNYYIGKSLIELNNTINGIYYFKKVDTILNEIEDVTPELIDTYNVLVAYYKSKNDDKNQLKYINSLLKFDSILEYNYKSLSNKIIRDYESKELLDEKNQLIDKLNRSKFSSKKLIIVFTGITLLLMAIVFFVVRKNLIYKKRFQSLINQKNNGSKNTHDEQLKLATKNTNLPEELVKEVLERLEAFEQSKKFLKEKYTLNSLAKELNTNSSYLSKIINETKQINFANYLNDLKIEVALDRLTNEKKFRAYTIKTIASEVGFNTAQSFSLAFYKKTGIYPSYFIKQIENRND
ncbi:helix-turn-helix domain-containing protein [Aquimarina sp. 2304DJ70-9]|uniref:helix-turn-helix domain-containing protein n=1 Tax=Aquimarina penaris TaxID=3231044 RepID=UPI0034617DC2